MGEAYISLASGQGETPTTDHRKPITFFVLLLPTILP
jgi:hypothetical protein